MEFVLDECKNLNDICRKNGLIPNFSNRKKVKQWFLEQKIDWKEWKTKLEKKKYCLNCGKELQRGQYKFCSSSCSAIFNNKKRGKRSVETRQKISDSLKKSEGRNLITEEINEVNFCLNCGKELYGYRHKYCSVKCKREHDYKQYIERWKRGEENGLKGEYGISNYIKHYLFEKNEYQCEQCGWNKKNPYTNTFPLEVHHIDGDYRNNKEENLQLLCPNCHSLTKTFKAANRNGRKGRKKYTK